MSMTYQEAMDEAMRAVETLTDHERTNLIRSCVRAALEYTRSGDLAYMAQHARNLLGTLRLRACPDYVEAIRRPPEPPLGEARRLDEVLAELDNGTERRPR